MFSSLATKVALKKVGLPSDTFDFSSWTKSDNSSSKPASKKITKSKPSSTTSPSTVATTTSDNAPKAWPGWMSVKSLPLTVQPWLTPRPPPVPVAEPPRVGDLAPLDRDRKLVFGNGKRVLIVFLRCVGCAFAQKTFLHLRALATRHPPTSPNGLTCIAVSHSSAAATAKWLDILGGTRGGLVQVVIDEERALYAAWGLGLGSVWYVFNPASQVAGFKEKGWLGERVAGSLVGRGVVGGGQGGKGTGGQGEEGGVVVEEGPVTTMGNKWQQAGGWAVDERGKVVWGSKAARVDDVLDLDAGVMALGVA